MCLELDCMAAEFVYWIVLGVFVLPNYVTNNRDYLWLYYFMITE